MTENLLVPTAKATEPEGDGENFHDEGAGPDPDAAEAEQLADDDPEGGEG